MLVCGITFGQQISVDDTLTPEQLIQTHLVTGCVEATNVTSPVNGSVNNLVSYGYFEKAESNFPFEYGIVLSSGEVSRVGNGQDNGIITSGNYAWGTDPAIEAALGIGNTLNATTVQFEFSSISDRIEFNYILASEEYYANFPCAFSDGFAFLIRRAGTNDPYENIALVPNSTTPVNTMTIRPEINGFCEAQNAEYFAGFNMGDTNFNGRTEVLTAVANIVPYEVYEIKLIVADNNDTNYDTAVFIEGNSFGSTIDLGPDFQTCASQVLLDGNINNSNASYTWFLNNEEITDANGPTYSASESGTYLVEVRIPLNNSECVLSDEINLIIDTAQNADPVSDYILCDTNNNGIQNFDLSSKTQEVLESVMASDYDISFHYSSEDAQLNLNRIETAINNTSNPQTIHTRIEDLNSGCIIYSTLNLVVEALPEVSTPEPMYLCAPAELNGQIAIDFSSKNDEITNGNTELIVNYHSNLSDAENGTNPLLLPYVNTDRTETIYVSILYPNTGCYNTTSFIIDIIDEPTINSEELLFIDACDDDHDGNAIFDLTSIIPTVIANTTGYNISFFESIEDVENNTNPIENEVAYANIEANVQVVYIRIEAINSGCFTYAPIELHTNLLLTGTNIRNFGACDEDGNGEEEFYFNSIAQTIINGLPNVSISFHLTEEDRDNEVNPIDVNEVFVNTSNPQTIYINLYSDTCSDTAAFDLIINPVIEFESVETLFVCDEDQDGLTTIDLSQFDEDVTFGDDSFSVSYFLSPEDAASNTNALPQFYTNTSNPYTLYPRITANNTGCSSSNSFEVVVQLAPETTAPDDIVICDMDLDGFFEINLNSIISQVVSSTEDRSISFHNSESDANSGAEEIAELNSYNAETEVIYIRVENSITGCHSIEELNIIVNTFPVIGDNGLVNQYLICEDSSDGIADFIFATRDDEIIGSQIGKVTSYHLTQADADNAVNAIDKNNPFLNTSNPQTIYVRLENITDTSCYDTGSFEIYVSTNPEFNIPTNIIVCDDISNNGSEPIDFSSTSAEISNGHPEIQLITYHLSEDDAISGENPIDSGFENTINPQQIFARIDDGTECKSITSFAFTVIQAPTVSIPDALVQCDIDADGTEIFDLTASEFDIFDIRQDDIVVTYHTTLEEAELGSNAIENPQSYNHNIDNNEVYIRVTNTISNCYVILPLELILNSPPAINDFVEYEVCAKLDEYVNLTDINDLVVTDSVEFELSYYNSLGDAENSLNQLDTNYLLTSINTTLFVRVDNLITGCFSIYDFNLIVNIRPAAYSPNDIEVCDDNYDGQLEVDLTNTLSEALGFQNPNNFNVSLHQSQDEADGDLNELSLNYLATDGEVIFVRVENIASGCYQTTSFMVFVNPLPILDIGDQVVCIDNLPLLVSADTGVTSDSYLWSTGETTKEIEITEMGDFWVTVTTVNGCSTTENFNVSESQSATVEFTEVLDFSDPNNITITVSGIGDYLYILDDGEPQESNVFEHVSLGYHIITIIDLNGCAPITKEVLVIDAPKFFTPNNDGQFDTWHITGVETLPGTEIYIYDRYGKLITRLAWDTPGWDGTFNGSRLAANDYWFRAYVQRGEIAFEVTGHFALRR